MLPATEPSLQLLQPLKMLPHDLTNVLLKLILSSYLNWEMLYPDMCPNTLKFLVVFLVVTSCPELKTKN